MPFEKSLLCEFLYALQLCVHLIFRTYSKTKVSHQDAKAPSSAFNRVKIDNFSFATLLFEGNSKFHSMSWCLGGKKTLLDTHKLE